MAHEATQWTWEEGDMCSEQWIEYGPVESAHLDQEWAQKTPKFRLGAHYDIDFTKSVQINTMSFFQRRIRRNGEIARIPSVSSATVSPSVLAPAAAAAPVPASVSAPATMVYAVATAAAQAPAAAVFSSLTAGSTSHLKAGDPSMFPARYEAIRTALLSPRFSTETQRPKLTYQPTTLSDVEVAALFREAVPGFDSKLDRLGETPILTYILGTFHRGLPSFSSDPAIYTHTRMGLQTIVQVLKDKPLVSRQDLLGRIADAFQNCQAIQAQVIDQVFGIVTGREQSLRDQLLALTDIHKQTALDQIIIEVFPEVNTGVEGPHMQNRVRMDIGSELGLPGIARAHMDPLADGPGIAESSRPMWIEKFRAAFNVVDLVLEFISDVNAQDDLPRSISHETLMRWATEHSATFNAHSVYFIEERADEYAGRPKNEYIPFLCVDTALAVFEALITEC